MVTTPDGKPDYLSPYFDQEEPTVPVVGLIAEWDDSQPYELNAIALFKAERGYLLVKVSGCSCWPDRGSTIQTHLLHKAGVDRAIADYPILKDAVQAAHWQPKK